MEKPSLNLLENGLKLERNKIYLEAERKNKS